MYIYIILKMLSWTGHSLTEPGQGIFDRRNVPGSVRRPCDSCFL